MRSFFHFFFDPPGPNTITLPPPLHSVFLHLCKPVSFILTLFIILLFFLAHPSRELISLWHDDTSISLSTVLRIALKDLSRIFLRF